MTRESFNDILFLAAFLWRKIMASNNTKSRTSSGKSTRKSTTGSTRRTSSSSRGTSSSTRRRKKQARKNVDIAVKNEVMLIIIFAAAIFLFLCVMHIIRGLVAEGIRDVMFGLFGLLAYLVPVIVFLGFAFGISNKGNTVAIIKLVSGAVLVLIAGIISYMIMGQNAMITGESLVRDLYQTSAEHHSGGGVLFGSIARGLYQSIGFGGTLFVLAVLGIISIVFITEKSFLSGIKKGGSYLIETAREDAARMREYRESLWDDEYDFDDMEEDYKESGQNRRPQPQPIKKKPKKKDSKADIKKGAKGSSLEDFMEVPEEKVRRMDKKARGVVPSVAVTFKDEEPSLGIKQDIHEIVLLDEEVKDALHEDIRLKPYEDAFDAQTDSGYLTDMDSGVPDNVQYNSSDGSQTIPEQYNHDADRNMTYDDNTYNDAQYQDSVYEDGIYQDNTYGDNTYEEDLQQQLADQGTVNQESCSLENMESEAANEAGFYQQESADNQEETYFDGLVYEEANALNENIEVESPNREYPPENELYENIFDNNADSEDYLEDSLAAEVLENVEDSSSLDDDELSSMPEPMTEETTTRSVVFESNELDMDNTDSDTSYTNSGTSNINSAAKPGTAANTASAIAGLPETSPVPEPPKKEYQFPPIELLKKGEGRKGDSTKQLKETALQLQQTLQTFGVRVTITDISQGPSVTRYEMQPEQGVKVSKIVGLTDDIKLNLAATDIRIEAPIPGKAAVGIEVPNKETSMVAFRDLLESEEFQKFPSNLSFAVGKDIAGQVVVTDIAKMPHVLIAGATGSGKSVCINTIIMSILYKAKPEDVKLIMIDPKVVELSVYNGIPHLMIPVVTDPKKASAALHWGVAEMTERYQKFADLNVRDLKGYNKAAEDGKLSSDGEPLHKMPQIVIIVDELADLMMVAAGEVEESICRLAQLARACGIHLVIATQRPSVDVITGLIKANMPSRIAFSVSSGVDSRTILDMNGAEKLLGKGDMLFYPQGLSKPARVQGAFISDPEVSDVVDFLKNQQIGNTYSGDIEEKIRTMQSSGGSSSGGSNGGGSSVDAYFVDAGKFVIEKDKASIGMLQRMYKIGFNRAARIVDQLEEAGVVGAEEGTKPRRILMSLEQFENYVEENL